MLAIDDHFIFLLFLILRFARVLQRDINAHFSMRVVAKTKTTNGEEAVGQCKKGGEGKR